MFHFSQPFQLTASSTFMEEMREKHGEQHPTIRHLLKRLFIHGPELESLGVFPTHPCAVFHRLLCTWTHRTASPDRPRTRLVACGTITQTSKFSKQSLPTPYACTLRSHPQRPVALPLGVRRGSGHARLGKAHRALTISGATTPCEHHVATTSLFKHPSACRDKMMWLALRFTQQVPIPQMLANTHHHQTTSHHDRFPDFVVGRAHIVLRLGPTSHRLVLRQSIEVMFVNFIDEELGGSAMSCRFALALLCVECGQQAGILRSHVCFMGIQAEARLHGFLFHQAEGCRTPGFGMLA